MGHSTLLCRKLASVIVFSPLLQLRTGAHEEYDPRFYCLKISFEDAFGLGSLRAFVVC